MSRQLELYDPLSKLNLIVTCGKNTKILIPKITFFCFRKESESASESDDGLPENAIEVEKNVIASAVKNNLDDVSVKKILKVSFTIFFATKWF